MSSLGELAAIRFLETRRNECKSGFNYYTAEDFLGIDNSEKIQTTIRILLELNLIVQRYLNNVPYYRLIHPSGHNITYKFTVDAEISKYKRTTFPSLESILRQAKLLHSIRSSGEDVKLIELIDKWETATKEVIGELYNHQAGDRSMKKFVKKLGLNWEDLGFSEPEDEESEHENESENNNETNDNNSINADHKRIKYED